MNPELERRIAELTEEIRRYPTPIARCDEHLAALLDERAKLIAELRRPAGCNPLAVWSNDGGFNVA